MSIVDVVRNVAQDPLVAISAVEPTAAKGDDCVFLTQSFSVRLSTDGGATFDSFPWSSPNSVFPGASTDFFGDQSTIWVSQTKRFVWAMIHAPSRDSTLSIRLAYTTSPKMKATQGKYWVWFDINPGDLGVTEGLDYPQLAIGGDFLYLTALLSTGTGVVGAALLRIPLRDLDVLDQHSVGFQFFVSRSTFIFGMAQRCGGRAFWASHEKSSNLLRVYWADETSSSIGFQDLGIPQWKTDAKKDYESLTPDPRSQNWLEGAWGRISGAFFGPDSAVFAWTAGRDNDAGRPHPYIYLIQLRQDRKTNKVTQVGIRHVWNKEHAWAIPGLGSVPSAGRAGPLAMSCAWGGGKKYFANHAVGFIDLPLSGSSAFVNKTVSKSSIGAARWGDFTTVRNDEFEALFLTAGYELQASTFPSGVQSVPHYVVFSPI